MATAVIQARYTSSRLPGKVLARIANRTLLESTVRAARQAAHVTRVVVATSVEDDDDPVAAEAEACGADVVRGPLDDVLARYVSAVGPTDETVVRLTADCPLLDPAVIDMAVAAFDAGDLDYLSTVHPRSLPRGLDVEVFSRQALMIANDRASGYQRVHVTPFLFESGNFATAGLVFQPGASDLRVTVDTAADLEVVRHVVSALGDDAPIPWRRLVEYLRSHPEVVAVNATIRQKDLEEG